MIVHVKKIIRKRRIEVLKPFSKSLHESCVRYTLVSIDKECSSAFVENFHDIDNVEVALGSILDLDTHALVSPANSFGEMSGGLDRLIDNFYDQQAQKATMKLIQEKYFGELPVGFAEIINMNSKHFPYLICAPTMRIPGKLAENSINAYLAMRAILIAIKKFNVVKIGGIKSVSIPSLCSGIGGIHYKISAEQMRKAFNMIEGGEYRKAIHPALAPY
jgi:O-acetyl-ADP-ribose deacetylase (regulator of RNase III)